MRFVLPILTLSGILSAQTFTSFAAPGARYVGWNRPIYDPVSQKVITWWSDWNGAWGTPSIYVNSAYTFRTSDGTYTKFGTSNTGQGSSYTYAAGTVTRGSGQTFQSSWVGSYIALAGTRFTVATVPTGNTLTVTSGTPSASGVWSISCPNSTSTWFGDRHTYGKMALDTRRNRIYQVGGACSDAYSPSQNHPEDTWFLQMAPLYTGIRFFQSSAPSMSMGAGGGGMEYSPTQDVMWLFHGGFNYLYCITDAGTLSAAQTTYGCTNADRWTTSSAPLNASGGSCSSSPYCPFTHPSTGAIQTGSKMVRRGEVFYWFNHAASGVTPVIIWTFDVASKRWTLLSTTSTPNANNSTASRTELFDYDPVNDLFWYYLPDNKHIYTFNPNTLAFSDRGAFSSLPAISELMVYDPSQHSIIIWDGNEGSGDVGKAWVGKLATSTSEFSVVLTVQEALFPGDATGGTGIARTNTPFCVGVPLKDAWNITSPTTELGLTGATSGQFRTLSYWPSGSVKWVEVCGIVASVSAGGTVSVTLSTGSGNF